MSTPDQHRDALPPPDMTMPSIAPDGEDGAHFYRAATVRTCITQAVDAERKLSGMAQAALAELVRLRDLEADINQSLRDGRQPGRHSTQEEIDAWGRLTADLFDSQPKAWEAARTAIAAAGQQPKEI